MNDITQPQPQGIDWKQQIQTWKLSGLSQTRFCKHNHLTYHRFVYWRRKFDDTIRVSSIKGSSEFPMGKSQTMVRNVVQESFFMEIFK